MSSSRIAVIGPYRSGSTALAGVLHHLGADMGAPFFRDYFEPDRLAQRLRIWWNEPRLQERTPREVRVHELAQWIREREQSGVELVGCKHPLLSLCGHDLLEAWGPDTKFLWSYRPLDESIQSLVRANWWPNAEAIQRTLWDAVNMFLRNRKHLRVDHSELLADPAGQVARIVEHLRLESTQQQIDRAVRSIKPRETRTRKSPGNHGPAAEALRGCATVDHRAEHAAQACYTEAKRLTESQEFERAIEACAKGLAKQPGWPELAWLAGWCCFKLGNYRDAIIWSWIAIGLGNVDGIRAGEARVSFRFLPGWYEAPYDVLRFAYRKLGDHAAASEAEQQFQAAKQMRLALPALRSHDQDLNERKKNGKRVYLDLGAHYGESLRSLSAALSIDSTWEVHVFEPNPACRIRERLKDWPMPIQIHEAAAWICDGTTTFRQQNHRVARNGSPADGTSDIDGWGSCLTDLDSHPPGLEPAIEVACQDLASMLENYSEKDYVVMKMDIEGAEFAILRHLIQRKMIGRISRLYVEWHERLLDTETKATRDALEQEIRDLGVEVVAWG